MWDFLFATSVVKWDAKKRKKRQERLVKIAQEAAEQSHRQVVPQVSLMETEKEFYETLSLYDVLLIAYEESAKQGKPLIWPKYFNLFYQALGSLQCLAQKADYHHKKSLILNHKVAFFVVLVQESYEQKLPPCIC